MSGWPDPARPGVPLNPEVEGPHLLGWADNTPGEFAYWWAPDHPRCRDHSEPACPGYATAGSGFMSPYGASRHYRYIGPVITPAQHAAEVERARRDEREACAKVIGQMRGRSNGPGTDQRKRALQAAEAAIRARGGSDG